MATKKYIFEITVNWADDDFEGLLPEKFAKLIEEEIFAAPIGAFIEGQEGIKVEVSK